MASKTYNLHIIVRQGGQESIKLRVFQSASVSSENDNSLKTNICRENYISSHNFHPALRNIWFKSLKLRLFYSIWRKVYIVSKTKLNFFKLKNLLCVSCQN